MSTWRERLAEALENSGMSMREASLAANCGHSYLHKVLKEGHEPTLDRLTRISDTLGVSVTWVLTGVEMDKQTETFTRLYSLLPDEQRQRVFDLLRAMAPAQSTPE